MGKRRKHYRVAEKRSETTNSSCCCKKPLLLCAIFVVGAFIDGMIIGYLLRKLSE